MKYEEQVKFLAANKVSIAVGTPARISKLLVDGQWCLGTARVGSGADVP